MQIVNTGHMYQIYDDGVKTFDQLPAQIYSVNFNKMTGFYLQKFDDIEITEKVYGVAPEKLEKVASAFKCFERNLGVILSGEKGIGKSLFAKMLSAKMASEGYPVLIVNNFIPGIADFLTSIQQEVVVLFDEFDKTFYAKDGDSMNDPQASMLTLFDGLSQGKKLFIVTCNKLNHLNDYIVNRPGRFHYHFRFDYPTKTEIEEYLQDKIDEQYFCEIEKVVAFANKIPLNYDCLRAISFELQCGTSFEDAISDLNILNIDNETYNLIVCFKDGTKLSQEVLLDMFSDERVARWFYLEDKRFSVEFSVLDIRYDYDRGGNIILAKSVDFKWNDSYNCYEEDSEQEKAEYAALKENKELDFLLFRRKSAKNIHYAV